MSQTDYILGFADVATAKADPDAAAHFDSVVSQAWLSDHAMPVTIKRISTGLPIAGFFVMISTSQPIPALLNHSALKIAVDRAKASARQAGAVLRSTVGGAVLQDMIINPVYAGADYPWGAFA